MQCLPTLGCEYMTNKLLPISSLQCQVLNVVCGHPITLGWNSLLTNWIKRRQLKQWHHEQDGSHHQGHLFSFNELLLAN